MIVADSFDTPQNDWCHIYTDASGDSGICCAGMLIADGQSVDRQDFLIEYSTGWISELRAIEYALLYVKQSKKKVKLFCDCDSVVSLLNRRLRENEKYAAAVIVRRIHELSTEFNELVIDYIKRDENPAHNIAYQALLREKNLKNNVGNSCTSIQ